MAQENKIKVISKQVEGSLDFNEDTNTDNLSLDTESPIEVVSKIEFPETSTEDNGIPSERMNNDRTDLVCCLKQEKVIVRYIPKTSGMFSNPKHVFSGGMSENAIRMFTVPIISSSGQYVNVLTNDEKTYLEYIMGLEPNALSVYLKKNNYWANYTVRLTKSETYLDLSNPNDYIKYKVLLANKDYISASISEWHSTPKATLQYVLIAQGEEAKNTKNIVNSTMEAYTELGKMLNDVDTLRVVIETLTGRPTSTNSQVEFLQGKCNEFIQTNAGLFLSVVKDRFLAGKVLIKKSIEKGLIYKRGDYLYLRDGNTPMCEEGQEPTLEIASRYLNSPKHQELKFSLEAKLK